MRSALFVAKDIGASNVTLPVAKLLSSAFSLYAATEGRAKDAYDNASFPIVPIVGDAWQNLAALKPAMVVVGASFPKSGLECAYAAMANEFSIPLAVIEDFWGGASRLGAVPDIVGVVDEQAAVIARERYQHADIIFSGNPGVRPTPLVPSPNVLAKVHELRSAFGRVLVLPLGIEYDVAEFFVECAKHTGGQWCIVPRVHPKLVGEPAPSGHGTYAQYFYEVLRTLGDRVQTIESGTTDEIAVASDGIITGASTVLVTAAQAGVPVLSLWTPLTAKAVFDSSGLSYYPLQKSGLPVIGDVQDLLACLHAPIETLRSSLLPYNAEKLAATLRTYTA